MKILFVTYSRAMLGANRSMLALIKDLRDRYGVESTVMMSDVNDGDLKEVLDEENFPSIAAPIKHWVLAKNKKFTLLRGLLRRIRNVKSYTQLKKTVDFNEYDIIYSNNAPVIMGAYIAHKNRKPHVWHIREYGEKDYSYKYDSTPNNVNKWFKRAAKVITVSDDLLSYAKSTIAKDADVIRIYNGVNVDKPLKEIWNTDNPIHFCIVGALSEGKNQLELLKAADILHKKGNDFHIEIIGSGEEYEAQLKEYAEQNRLQSNITFHGYQNDAVSYIQKFDVGIVCSKAEAFGRVTCEYMCLSMPVIGAKAGGTAELIKDGEDGCLYEPGDIETLADKMEYFIENRESLVAMGTKAYNKASTQFTVKANTDAIYSELTKIITS